MWAEEEAGEDEEGERLLRLSSADRSGSIAIWKQQAGKQLRLPSQDGHQAQVHQTTPGGGEGGWVTELINVDHKKQIAYTAWSADGLKVCIVYADGNLIIGHVSGERLWGKDLRRTMIYAAWSPDSKKILLASKTGEIFFYTADGLYSHRLRTQLGDDEEGRSEPLVPIAGKGRNRATPRSLSLNQPKEVLQSSKLFHEDVCLDKGRRWFYAAPLIYIYTCLIIPDAFVKAREQLAARARYVSIILSVCLPTRSPVYLHRYWHIPPHRKASSRPCLCAVVCRDR